MIHMRTTHGGTEAQRHRANQMYLCVSVSLCVVGTCSQ